MDRVHLAPAADLTRTSRWLVPESRIASSSASLAARRRQGPHFGPIGVDHFDVAEGPPGGYVADLSVADHGRLWLRASGRLVSFDGLELETHDLSRFPVPDPQLHGVAAGTGDTVWVALQGGIFSYVGSDVEARHLSEARGRSIWQDGSALWGWDRDLAGRLGPEGLERVPRLRDGFGSDDPETSAVAGSRSGTRKHSWTATWPGVSPRP